MYRQILVPLDGSPLAEEVLPYVKQLSVALKAKIKLIHIVEPLPREIKDTVRVNQVLATRTAKKRAQNYLDAVSGYFKASDTKLVVSTTIGEGNPVEGILSESKKEQGTLVAMTKYGQSATAGWLLGSVAEKVLRESQGPILLVRPNQRSVVPFEPPMKHIIVPLDQSPNSEQVFPAAIDLANAAKLKVTFVRVTPWIADYYKWGNSASDDFSGAPAVQLFKQMDEEAMKYLNGVASKYRNGGLKEAKVRLFHGDAASAIIELANETPGSFIAMTTRGLSSISRNVLGSVTDRVVRNSIRPVLVIRPSDKAP